MTQHERPILNIDDLIEEPSKKNGYSQKTTKFVGAAVVALIVVGGAFNVIGSDDPGATPSLKKHGANTKPHATTAQPEATATNLPDEPQPVELIAQLPQECIILGNINTQTSAITQWNIVGDTVTAQVIPSQNLENSKPEVKSSTAGEAEVCFSGEEVTRATKNKVVLDMSTTTIGYNVDPDQTTAEVRDLTISRKDIGDFVLLALNTTFDVKKYNQAVDKSTKLVEKDAKILASSEVSAACAAKAWEPAKEVAKYLLTQQYAEQEYTGSVELVFRGAPENTVEGLNLRPSNNEVFTIIEPQSTCRLTFDTKTEAQNG